MEFNVLIVLLMIPVPLVLTKLEVMLQFVIVEITIMKMQQLNVQLVTKNVTFVSTIQPIVLFVPKTELIHQNVFLLHQLLNLLQFKISQLVLPELFFVTLNVILVKELKPIV